MPTFARSTLRLLVLLLPVAFAAAGCAPAAQFDCVGNCELVCSMPGEACSETTACCAGMTCAANNTCCSMLNEPCADSAGCCEGLACDDGVCACLAEGAACGTTAQECCGGLSCDGTGHCRGVCPLPVGACEPYGAACTDDADCCAAASCVAGRCADPSRQPACAVEGAACATAADCCGSPTWGSQPDCVAIADGGSICSFAREGQPCGAARHCLPGTTCVFPVIDAGMGDAGIDDGGVDDGGVDDGGTGVDAGSPADAGTVDPVGTCTRPSSVNTCTLYSATCGVGDACNPNSSTNQGYDPCGARVVNGYLRGRTPILACGAGRCRLPVQGEPCSTTCLQTPGDPRQTVCNAGYDNSRLCMPQCATDADCRNATAYDSRVYSPQPVTNLCVRYGTFSACQPALCYVDGEPGLDDTSVLYKPCPSHPGTICEPRYVGDVSTVLGFCMAARPDAGSTVGQTCDPRAGMEAAAATCGADAVCMGGRCAALCDASQLGGAGTPACTSDLTCVSAQGLDLVAAYQVGGCVDPCNPFTDLEHSGCVNYCGGPAARCNWLIGDPAPGEPMGYCGAAVTAPLPTGSTCTRDPLDPCEAGNFCLLSSDGVTRKCARLCDPTSPAGAPDACPGGQSCTAFDPLTRSGYCR